MAKKKKYKPKEHDGWDEGADREHRRTIDEKTKAIGEMYKKWWDKEKHGWKKGFNRYGNS